MITGDNELMENAAFSLLRQGKDSCCCSAATLIMEAVLKDFPFVQ